MSFQDDQVFLEKYLDENLNTVLGLRLAERYISAGNLEGAHLILSEFLESHPTNATALFFMGEIAFKEGDNDKAKSHYENTIHVDPTYVAAYHRLVTICSDEGNEAEVTDIYRLLNLVNPMDKKAAAELEGKDESEASKSGIAERLQTKFHFTSEGDSDSSTDSEESTEETEENVDSLADELSMKLDVDDSENLDMPLDGADDEPKKENSEESAEAKDSDEWDDPFVSKPDSEKEEDAEKPDEGESIEPVDESGDDSVEKESEEDTIKIEETESAEDVVAGDEESKTEDSEESTEAKETDDWEDPFASKPDSEKEEDSEKPDEIESTESADESGDDSVDEESEEAGSIMEESEPAENVVTEEKDIESAESTEDENIDSVEEGEKLEEEVSSDEDSKSTDVDAFGIGVASEETSTDTEKSSEDDSSAADDSDSVSEDIATDEDSEKDHNEIEADEPLTDDAEDVEENEKDEKSEEILSDESSEESEEGLDSDEGESTDSIETTEEIDSKEETGEIESESLAESTDETDSELDDSDDDKGNSAIEMPPFSKETLADVEKIQEITSESEEDIDAEGETETDKEEVDEDKDDNVEEGVESLNLPLNSEAEAITKETESNEQSGDDESAAADHNIPIDSVEQIEEGELDTPPDYESWVEKDATPESMTKGKSDADESHKNTFEGLLSEDETSREVDTMEIPEESDSGIVVEEDEIQKGIDDIYSLAQIDDEEDASPLQAWFLDRKNIQDEDDQNEDQIEDEDNPDTITEPKPVPFSGESEEEAEALQDTEENESEEKWDEFVDKAVEKKGEDDPKDSDSVSTDIDRELKNIFDEVAAPTSEQDLDEANADAPDVTGGVKLNSDLATFTLADIYINQSQFSEALLVLDLLEKKGEKLERVASMREEIKVKIEARNK